MVRRQLKLATFAAACLAASSEQLHRRPVHLLARSRSHSTTWAPQGAVLAGETPDAEGDGPTGPGVASAPRGWAAAGWPPPASETQAEVGSLAALGILVALTFSAAIACLLLGRACIAFGALSPHFSGHLVALASASLWRHLHRGAALAQLARTCAPLAFLLLLRVSRQHLVEWLDQPSSEPLLQLLSMNGLSPQDVVEAFADFLLLMGILYVALVSMVSLANHLAAEAESGLRRLLHVSGLSRAAYLLAAVGVEGTLQAAVGIGMMLSAAAIGFQVRVALHTSPVLWGVMVLMLVLCSSVMAALLPFLCGGTRCTGFASQLVFVVVVFAAPAAYARSAVPGSAGQAWTSLALPVIPACRAMFEMSRACYLGQCMQLGDLATAWAGGRLASPFGMVRGVPHHREPTPPEALLSLFGLLVLQLAAGLTTIALLDSSRHPALHLSNRVAQPAREAEEGRALVLQVQGLEHSYGWLASDGRRVLNGLSFEVTQGATLGLLGPNGAGKTTAIRCITGEEAAFGGTVAIHGDWNACIGLCPQDTVLNMDLSVSENMRFFAMLRRGSRGRDTVDCVERILGAAGLREKADWLPSALSGGMRRRLSVACAMVGGPSVAILDEPTTGLDPMSRRGIWDAVDGLKAGGGCCLLTTHMMEEAEALCTGVIVLAEGKLAASGSTQQLKEVWGAGYLLKLDVEQGREDGVKVYVESLLPAGTNAPLKTSNEGQMTFTVPPDPKVVGRLFLDLAEGAASHGVLHWGISQCSLEDAYLRVVRSAVDVPAEA